jgi:hypothetical protein
MAFVFLDDICFWRRYDLTFLYGPDALADLIQMTLCRGIRFSRYLRTFSTVTEVHVSKWPFWMDLSHVSATGLKQHACKYVMVSPMDFCS